MYSEWQSSIEKILLAQDDRFRNILEKGKVSILIHPPSAGIENFLLTLPEKIKNRISIVDMALSEEKEFPDGIIEGGKNLDTFEIKDILNFEDFRIKKVTEEFLEQVRKFGKKKALIYAHQANEIKGWENNIKYVLAKWMNIEYIIPGLLNLNNEELKDKYDSFLKTLKLLSLDYENLGFHSVYFHNSLDYLDKDSILELNKILSSTMNNKNCPGIVTSILLILFHNYGSDYNERMHDLLNLWENMHNDHRKIVASQISLELGIRINDAYDCLNTLDGEKIELILKNVDPFFKSLENEIRFSLKKIDCKEIANYLGIGQIPLPCQENGDLGSHISQALEKIQKLSMEGSIVISGRDRHENACIALPLLNRLCPANIFLQGRFNVIGMDWLIGDGILLALNKDIQVGKKNLIVITDNLPDGVSFLESYGPIKIYSNNNIYYVSFSWDNYMKEIVKIYLNFFIPGKFGENEVEKISLISNNSLSNAYSLSFLYSALLSYGYGTEDSLGIISKNNMKAYVSMISDKLSLEQILCLYECTYYPLGEKLIDYFNLNKNILEKYPYGYKVPDEFAGMVKDLFNEKLGDEIDKRFYEIIEYLVSSGLPENLILKIKNFEQFSKVDLLSWHNFISKARYSRDFIYYIYNVFIKRSVINDVISITTVHILVRDKNVPGIFYTPIKLAFETRDPFLIPYIFAEYGRESIEGKIVYYFFNSLINLGLLENFEKRMLDYLNGVKPNGENDFIYNFINGSYLIEKKDYEGASREFNACINRNHLFAYAFLMNALSILRMEGNVNSIARKKELLESAKQNIDGLISIDAKNFLSYMLKGFVYQRLSRIEKDRVRKLSNTNLAKNEFERGLSINGQFSPLLSGKGDCIFDIGMMERDREKKRKYIEEALNAYSSAIDYDPGNVRAIYGYGNCLLELSKFERSINNKRDLLIRALEQYDKCISFIERPEAINGRGNALLSLARIETNVKKRLELLNSALKEYERSSLLDPNMVENYIGIGNTLLELSKMSGDRKDKIDKINRAIKYYETGLNIDSLNTFLHYGKGEALLELSRITEGEKSLEILNASLREYENSIKIDGEFVHAYNGAGNAYLEMLREEKNKEKRENYLRNSLKYFEKAIMIDKNYPLAYNGRSVCYALMAKEEKRRNIKRDLLLKSISDLENAIREDPFLPMTYHNYGNRLLELSELEDDLKKRVELIESSIKKYEEAISLDPLFKYSYNGIGNCYYKLAMLDKEKRRHFLEKAIEYYEKAIALDNEYSTPKKNIEICKVLLKKI